MGLLILQYMVILFLGIFIGYYIRRIKSAELPNSPAKSPYSIEKYYSEKKNNYLYRILKNKKIYFLNEGQDFFGYPSLKEIQQEINDFERTEGYKLTVWGK